MSTVIEIADAVVDLINNAEKEVEVTATRKVVPEFEMRKLENIAVVVVPRSIDSTRVTRIHEKHRFGIDIAVMQKASMATEIESFCNDMCDVVSEIRSIVNGVDLSEPAAKFISCGINPVYSMEHLSQHRTFLSVIKCEYDVMEDVQ